MKKSVLTGINQIEIIEAPVPEIKNGDDVLIRMKRVGVCGSDIHYYSTGKIGSQVVQYPFTVGHEGAGVVEKVGSRVTSVKPGDPIAIEPSVSCGHCDQCKTGRPHTCRNNLFLGCPGQLEGNLAEFIVMPESQCLKLAEGQDIDDGATSEPLAIGLYAVRRADLSKDDTVGIIGFGPIGMSVMQMAQAAGIKNILISEKIEARKEAALKQGAVWAGNPLKEDIEQEVEKQQPDMLDVVFECSGDQDGLNTAVDLLKPGGKLVMIGIPEFDRWSFSADLGRRKEITFINIRRQNNCTHDTLEMLADGRVNGSAMITHRFPFNQVSEAFDLVKNYRDGVMKAMIEF
ncbi:MAG: alcohol dehydrogenase catalytic domain-containing protein [Bacteroidales bacterium]